MRRLRLALLLLPLTLVPTTAQAEVRTITATGEYRMGDNDTRTDAKRLTLEQAGTYIESLTEVRNLQPSRDEVRAYTAGIVEVTEQHTKSAMEGETQFVRVDVTCKIDTAVVTRQIEALRRNETVKSDLLRAQQDNERLRRENEALSQKLAAATSEPAIEALQEKRREVLTDQDVNSLLAQAWVALRGGDQGNRMVGGSSTAEGRSRALALLTRARALDPDNIEVQITLGMLFSEEGRLSEAITSYREALRLDPQAPPCSSQPGGRPAPPRLVVRGCG